MTARGVTRDRSAQPSYENECQRLCGYIKNDSIIRWYGYSQEQIDEARRMLAGRRMLGSYEAKLRCSDEVSAKADNSIRLHRKRAEHSNRRYLAAVARVAG